MYNIRWIATNFLFGLGLWIAPRGAARDLLLEKFYEFGEQIRHGSEQLPEEER